MFWVSGACFAISARAVAPVGGFDEDYFLYWEDVDFSRRVRAAGGSVRVILDTASAVHDEGGTHDDRPAGRAKSETYYYYNIRNRLLFAQRLARRGARPALAADGVARRRGGSCMQGGRRQLHHGRRAVAGAGPGLRDGRRGITGPRA